MRVSLKENFTEGLAASERVAAKGFSLAEMSGWPEARASAELEAVFSSW